MIKRFHESPKSLFKEVQQETDGDYFLVHLFEEDEEYWNLGLQSVKEGREVILDNSIFELGNSFSNPRFSQWVDRLQPTWYVVPDSLENKDQTISNMEEWNDKYRHLLPGKVIGVVQGRTYEELVECYQYMDKKGDVDMIAISFDYSFYETLVPTSHKLVSWMLGRPLLVKRLLEDGVLNQDKPHHLLGCSLPQEGILYSGLNMDFIYSIDTSNPIVHGIKGVRYGREGLWSKESQKLVELINNEKPNNTIWLDNIHDFKKFWS